MFARRCTLSYFLFFVAVAVLGCQPNEPLQSNEQDAIFPDAADAVSVADENQPDEGVGLAEILIDPGDIEIANASVDAERSVDTESAANDVDNELRTNVSTNEDDSGTTVNHAESASTEPLVVATPSTPDLTGMRQLTGRYVTIITDLPSSADVNELALVFDKAVGQWAQYFGIPAKGLDGFSMTGYVMQSKERFQSQGMLPQDLPPFLNGYQRGDKFWVYDQPSGYYRRHLVLHEGTHGFMEKALGGTGAPWYREGIADFLATHSWQQNQLRLGYMPKNRDEVPYWGRIKLLKEAFAKNEAKMIHEVMRLETRDFMNVDAYAWSWAAVTFLDSDPMFRVRFRELRKTAKDNTVRFTRHFEQQVINELREMDESWQLFVANIEYGYDFDRSAVIREPGRPLPTSGAVATIKADHGWQSTGYRLETGKEYLIRASGKCVVQAAPEVWTAEPGGVTLRYYKGEPIGRLLGNVRFDQARPGLANLVLPLPIGLGRVVQPESSGTLYLKINDSPAELSDNEGEFNVQIVPRE